MTRAGSAGQMGQCYVDDALGNVLRAASSSVRLAHLQDFCEWITRPSRSRLRFRVTMKRRPARRDHLGSPDLSGIIVQTRPARAAEAIEVAIAKAAPVDQFHLLL